jgi:Ig-like domain-containing protein
MKANSLLLPPALLLAAVSTSFCQPVIPTQPSSVTNIAGTTATFSVEASGTEPLHYQWQFNALERTDQTNAILVLTNVQTGTAGSYTIVVTNVAGATSQVATLTVDPTFTKITTGPIVTDVGLRIPQPRRLSAIAAARGRH